MLADAREKQGVAMKAVGYRKCLTIDQADALVDLEIPPPAAPTGRAHGDKDRLGPIGRLFQVIRE